MNPLSAITGLVRNLTTIQFPDVPDEVREYAEIAFDKCCQWFGLPDDAEWPYTLLSGNFTSCVRGGFNMKNYAILTDKRIVTSGDECQLLAAIGNSMYNRVTWNIQGLRRALWVDHTVARCVSLRLLREAGHASCANRLAVGYRCNPQLPSSELRLANMPVRRIWKADAQPLPNTFYNATGALACSLDALLDWGDFCRLPGSKSWQEWLNTLSQATIPLVCILLSPIEPGVRAYESALPAVELTAHQHSCLAFTLYKGGRFEDAQKECRTAIEMEPDDPHPYQILCAVSNDLGHYDEAKMRAQAVIRFNPEDPASYAMLGDICSHAGSHAEAVEAYNRAFALEPENQNYEAALSRAISHFNREA